MRASEYLLHQCSDVDNAVCEHQDYKSGNGNAHTDGRQRPFKAHIQQRGDERARPRPGSGQGYRNEYEKSPEAVRLNGLGLFLALVLDKGRQLIENMVLFHPFYHFSGKQDEKRHGQHIAHKAYGKRRPRVHAGRNADGYGAADLEYRQHRRNERFEYVFKH